MVPEIYAKSVCRKVNLDVKYNIGCEGIELHLFKEFWRDVTFSKDRGLVMEASIENCVVESTKHCSGVRVVHAPIECHENENLEQLISDKNDDLFESLFAFSEFCSKATGVNTILVVHSAFSMCEWSTCGNVWDLAVKKIGEMLLKYPSVELAIENVSVIEKQGETYTARDNTTFDNVAFSKMMRATLDTERIGTVLDTCHVLMVNDLMRYVKGYYSDNQFLHLDLSMNNFFVQNRDVIKLIHLDTMDGDGLSAGCHGRAFSSFSDSEERADEERKRLTHILKLYKKYELRCPITLEVNESNYYVCNNYKNDKGLVEQVIAEVWEKECVLSDVFRDEGDYTAYGK